MSLCEPSLSHLSAFISGFDLFWRLHRFPDLPLRDYEAVLPQKCALLSGMIAEDDLLGHSDALYKLYSCSCTTSSPPSPIGLVCMVNVGPDRDEKR